MFNCYANTVLYSRERKSSILLGQVLRMCANAVKSEKTEMGNYFRRMKSRSGHAQAIVATAHKITRILYSMIKTKKEYNPRLVGMDEKELLKKKIERARKTLNKLERRFDEAV